ncbi:uridine kinase family protein [Streptomyces sp. XH2]|uniref:uridine kinase family protein n=1 Tax=Streptomyces sp. XH2 TaxID=3412483 RepID=UPI003C7DC17E
MAVKPQQIHRIVAAITARAVHDTALVALDGRAGAGKTTLATILAEHLGGPQRATVIHGDDYLLPRSLPERLAMDTVAGYAGYFDWPRLRDHVLMPLSGRPPADRASRPATVGTVPRGKIVIVEGVQTARPELAAYYDLRFFVDTSADLCLRRLHDRGRTPEWEAWITRWRAVEEYYLTTTHLHTRVDLTVHDGYLTDPTPPLRTT